MIGWLGGLQHSLCLRGPWRSADPPSRVAVVSNGSSLLNVNCLTEMYSGRITQSQQKGLLMSDVTVNAAVSHQTAPLGIHIASASLLAMRTFWILVGLCFQASAQTTPAVAPIHQGLI